MAVFTGLQLIERVRDYADQPDDGQPNAAYVNNTMITRRLSTEIRRAYRIMARHGMFVTRQIEELSAGATVSLGDEAMCILSVSHVTGSTRTPLARLMDTEDPYFANSSSVPTYWRPTIDVTGQVSIELFPTPTSGSIRVMYVMEPVDVGEGTNHWLTGAMEDMVVLGAACRCYAKEDGSNAYLMQMYERAVEEVEADAAQYSARDGGVIRNSDAIYPPGEDQTQAAIDPSDVWYAP